MTTLQEIRKRNAIEQKAYHDAAKRAAFSIPPLGSKPATVPTPAPAPQSIRQPRNIVTGIPGDTAESRRIPRNIVSGGTSSGSSAPGGGTSSGSSAPRGGAAASAAPSGPFVGPKQPRPVSPVSLEGQAWRNRAQWTPTPKPAQPGMGSRIMDAMKVGGKVGAGALNLVRSVPVISTAIPGIQAYNAAVNPELSEQQKRDAYVRAGLEGGGGFAGGAAGAAAAKYLPGKFKVLAPIAGALAGYIGGSKAADSWMSEAPRSSGPQISREPLVQGSTREPTADELAVPDELAGMAVNDNPLRDDLVPQPAFMSPQVRTASAGMSVSDYLANIRTNAGALPDGTVEIIRGLNKSYALPTTVNGPMPEIDEGIFRPGVAQGRQLMDSFGGSERAAAASIDQTGNLAATDLRGQYSLALEGAKQQKMPSINDIYAGAILDIQSGDDARTARGRRTLELLNKNQSTEQSQLESNRKELANIMFNPQATPAEKAEAMKRLQELKIMEDRLGVR